MANFIGLVFATLKNEGVDTKGMSTDKAIKKYNELKGEKEGTPAEQRKMKQPRSDKLNYDYLDDAEKYYVGTEGRTKTEIKGFKDAIEYMNKLANEGKSYKEIEDALDYMEIKVRVERRNLDNKEHKTEGDIKKSRELMEYHSGVNFGVNRLYRAWKK